jgi:hypothetical protein
MDLPMHRQSFMSSAATADTVQAIDLGPAIRAIKSDRNRRRLGVLFASLAVVVLLVGGELLMLSQDKAPNGPPYDAQPGQFAPLYD